MGSICRARSQDCPEGGTPETAREDVVPLTDKVGRLKPNATDELLRPRTRNVTFTITADRAHNMDALIQTIANADANANQLLRELFRRAVAGEVMHPSGQAKWASWQHASTPDMLHVLRPAIVRSVVCHRPSTPLRGAITRLWDELAASAAAGPHQSGCMAKSEGQPKDARIAFDAALAVQIRTMKDASNYKPNTSYAHYWPCVAAAAHALQAQLQSRHADDVDGGAKGAPPRVLVWLTSDDLPRLSREFFAALAPLSKRSNIVLAVPACVPTPQAGIATDSRKGGAGMFEALSHWWAIGASEAMVTGGTTYSYSAWLRARRGAAESGLDFIPGVGAAGRAGAAAATSESTLQASLADVSVANACVDVSASTRWR